MHDCPKCGTPTEGYTTKGGASWALCPTCGEKEDTGIAAEVLPTGQAIIGERLSDALDIDKWFER